MATTIKLKSGSGAPLAGDLVAAEPAFDLTNKRLYTEDSGGTVIEVGTNPTSLTTGTFTSTGIDDNATSTAITIDSGQRTFFNCGFSRPITVVSTSTNAFVGLQDANSGSTGHVRIGSEANDMVFYANAQERMRIKGANVGIGETNPDKELVVRGSTQQISRFSTSSGTRGYITFADANTTTENNQGIGVVGNDVKIWAGNAEAVTIDSSGNMGINLSDPDERLEVGGDIKGNTGGGAGVYHFGATSDQTKITGRDSSHATLPDTMEFFTGGTSRMKLDASGNVGIGTDNPTYKVTTSGTTGFVIDTEALLSDAGVTTIGVVAGGESINLRASGTGFHQFSNGSAEVMRIDSSGNLLVGTTSVINGTQDAAMLSPNTGGEGSIRCSRNTTGPSNQITFWNNNGKVGSITTSGTATAYNISSDVRLKENITDADSSGSVVDALQVRQFDWKADGEHQRYGFVAQELDLVYPEAVSKGETEEDTWGVDYSKLVPMMIKEIQDLKAEVAALKGA